jgi:HEAT repeat protein
MEEDRSPEGLLKWRVHEAFLRLGSAGVPHLAEALRSSDKTTRRNAAVILGEVGAPTAVDALIEGLRRGQPGAFLDDRKDMVVALGKIGDEKAIPILREIILNPREDRYTVRDAIWAFQKMSSRTAAEALMHLLPTLDRNGQADVIEVLGRIGHASAVPTLRQFESDGQPADGSGSRINAKPMRVHAAEALEAIAANEARKAIAGET